MNVFIEIFSKKNLKLRVGHAVEVENHRRLPLSPPPPLPPLPPRLPHLHVGLGDPTIATLENGIPSLLLGSGGAAGSRRGRRGKGLLVVVLLLLPLWVPVSGGTPPPPLLMVQHPPWVGEGRRRGIGGGTPRRAVERR
jgi:hypothetical protein